MKRVWPAWLLLFLGAFFLTAAGVAQFWAKDAAERTPYDSYQRTYLTGPAKVLNAKTGKVSLTPVKITNITQVDDKRSDSKVIVFVTSTCVNKDIGNPPDCLPKSDKRMISDTQLNFAADRHTAEAVNNPKYVTNEIPVEGLVNKWPFYPQRHSYQVWDDTSKQATPADYVGTTTIQGLKVYQYHQVITDAPIDLGNNIKGIYSLDEIYSIDTVTGKIIDQKLHDVRKVKDGGQTALDLHAEYTPGTIKYNVDKAKSGGQQLTLTTKVVPIAGLVAGILCLVAGALLLMRARRRSEQPEPAEEPAQV